MLYYIGLNVASNISGITLADTYNGVSGVGKFRSLSYVLLLIHATRVYVFTYFEHPVIFHSEWMAVLNMLILLVIVALMIRIIIAKRIKSVNLILLLILTILIPYGMNVVYFISQGMSHNLMIYSFFFVYVLALWLLREYLVQVKPKWIKKGFERIRVLLIPTLIVVFLFHSIVYANQTYLKKELEQQTTLSTMTRVIDRMEQTEGYITGETPVVIVGLLEYSEVSKRREGFDYSGTGVGCNFSVTYYDSYQYYFEHYLSYPINLVSEEEAREWYGLPEIIEMPKFPEIGCCQMLDGVMVVRLS